MFLLLMEVEVDIITMAIAQLPQLIMLEKMVVLEEVAVHVFMME
jgi:hypothetical protein